MLLIHIKPSNVILYVSISTQKEKEINQADHGDTHAEFYHHI